VLAITLAALVLRAVLAFVVYPGLGFSSDMDAFLRWIRGLDERGPAGFYAADRGANYPPVGLLALWAMRPLADAVGPLVGYTPAEAVVGLVKLPGILGEVGCVPLAAALATRLRDRRAGLVAAVLVACTPVLFYTSALWGQIDGLLCFFALLALWLLVARAPELACVAAVAAYLVKPQGIVVSLVVGAAILGRYRGRPGRVVSSALTGFVATVAALAPFDYEALAPAGVRSLPLLGDLTGFLWQSIGTGGWFPFLTVNAYNVWALPGTPSLAESIGTGRGVWNADAVRWAGLPASVWGLLALLVALGLVVAGLLRRQDDLAVVLGFVVASYALFGLPTRVHERYLVPAFAAGAVLAATHLGKLLAFLLAASLNLVNLHAVLANRLIMAVNNGDGTATVFGSTQVVAIPGRGAAPPPQPPSGGGGPAPSGEIEAGNISLPG